MHIKSMSCCNTNLFFKRMSAVAIVREVVESTLYIDRPLSIDKTSQPRVYLNSFECYILVMSNL